ncbi:hypothetical protein ACQ7B2_12325, partial [Escherichia coli]
LPVVAIPVLVASFAGWTFGLPFIALALVATGFLAARSHAGNSVTAFRRSHAARVVLLTTALITLVAGGVGAV